MLVDRNCCGLLSKAFKGLLLAQIAPLADVLLKAQNSNALATHHSSCTPQIMVTAMQRDSLHILQRELDKKKGQILEFSIQFQIMRFLSDMRLCVSDIRISVFSKYDFYVVSRSYALI